MRKMEEALDLVAHKMLQKWPESAISFYLLGVFYRDAILYQKSLDCALQAIEIDNLYDPVYNLQGLIQTFLGNAKLGAECCTESIKLNSENALYYVNRAKAYQKLAEQNPLNNL